MDSSYSDDISPTTIVFDRNIQPYGTIDELMDLNADELTDAIDNLFNQWGGNDLKSFSVLECMQFAIRKFPYESPVHLFTLHRTYIGQLGALMVACQHSGLFNTRLQSNTVILWKIKQVCNCFYIVCLFLLILFAMCLDFNSYCPLL
jgi:hypothetical protein